MDMNPRATSTRSISMSHDGVAFGVSPLRLSSACSTERVLAANASLRPVRGAVARRLQSVHRLSQVHDCILRSGLQRRPLAVQLDEAHELLLAHAVLGLDRAHERLHLPAEVFTRLVHARLDALARLPVLLVYETACLLDQGIRSIRLVVENRDETLGRQVVHAMLEALLLLEALLFRGHRRHRRHRHRDAWTRGIDALV